MKEQHEQTEQEEKEEKEALYKTIDQLHEKLKAAEPHQNKTELITKLQTEINTLKQQLQITLIEKELFKKELYTLIAQLANKNQNQP